MVFDISIRTFPKIEEKYKIKLEMSRNAMYGFSAHCKYQSIVQSGANDNHWHVDPLGYITGYKNQVFGFYLTPASPDLVIGFKKDSVSYDKNSGFDEFEDINLVEMSYEKECDNIVNIIVTSKDNEKLKIPISSLELSFTRNGLIKLSEVLNKLANDFNYDNSIELDIDDSDALYSIEIISKSLGIITDYDSTL